VDRHGRHAATALDAQMRAALPRICAILDHFSMERELSSGPACLAFSMLLRFWAGHAWR
jgi:hypothetical protein